MEVSYSYYDYARGWEHTNPGWHEVSLDTKSSDYHLKIVQWLYDNIDNPERHARWILHNSPGSQSGFKFRYERDCIWFKLRWL